MPRASRSSGNFRLFAPESIERVRFIKQAQELGLTLEEIKGLLATGGADECRRVRDLLSERIKELDIKMRAWLEKRSEVMIRMNCVVAELSGSHNCMTERSDRSGEVELGSLNPACEKCFGQGRPVSRKTVMLMLKPDLLDQANTGTYSFCSARDCPVVYFDHHGTRCFTVDDLRTKVGVKAKEDPIHLCYCFGFDERHMREEISQTGETTILKRFQDSFERVYVRVMPGIPPGCVAWVK